LDPPEDDPTQEKPRCSYACRKYHFFLLADPPQYWIRVYKLKESPDIEAFHFPKPCQNCQDAPCKRVCPTGATFQRKDGTVLIDQDICIGCRICMAACPYETRFFWYNDPVKEGNVDDYNYSPEFPVPHSRGTVVKCDYCIHKVYHNQAPHCVSACPKGALYFGDLNEDAIFNGREVIPLHQTLNNSGGYRYKQDEGTEPSVYYLPVLNPELTTLNTTLTFNVERSLNQDKDAKATVLAEDENGNPVKSSKIRIETETMFGPLILAEGLTNSRGQFSCTIESNKKQAISARLLGSDKYKDSEVKLNG
ncbi:MAG: 4Fe-4S dicluster domain-containing protein, partial [Candidatus Kariarchaeaceae archaeon]